MVEFEARIQQVTEELMGNESLLEMLETEAATEMLNWGIEMATDIVKSTKEMDGAAAEETIQPRLKALRRTMRSAGNWAAGQYTDPESRLQLRDKLLDNFRMILGEDGHLPSPEEMDELLNQVDDTNNTPHQLILKLKQSLEEPT